MYETDAKHCVHCGMDYHTVDCNLLCVMNAIRQLHLIIIFVRRLLIVLMLIGVITIPYAIGQWIDGDNLLFELNLTPFWECDRC